MLAAARSILRRIRSKKRSVSGEAGGRKQEAARKSSNQGWVADASNFGIGERSASNESLSAMCCGGAAFGLSRNQNSRPVVISGFSSTGSTNWGSSTKALLTFVLTGKLFIAAAGYGASSDLNSLGSASSRSHAS